jgi:hypothetical protein
MHACETIFAVAAALSRPWPFSMAGVGLLIVPRRAFDAVIYLDLGRSAQR